MLKNISFGQYYPANSVIHRLDARLKIIATVLFIVMVFFAESYSGYAIMGILLLSIILLSKVPPLTVLRSVRTVLVLVLFATLLNVLFYREGRVLFSWKFITVTAEGLIFASKTVLRIIMLVMGAFMLTLTTTPMNLTDGIESLLSPLKAVKFPVHDFAITMSIALRFIPTLTEETNKIMNAQKSRGACFDEGGLLKRAKALLPILIPLVVSAFRRADELGLALDARCYNATDKRTKYKEMHFGGRDYAALVVLCSFFAVLLLDKYLLGGLF